MLFTFFGDPINMMVPGLIVRNCHSEVFCGRGMFQAVSRKFAARDDGFS